MGPPSYMRSDVDRNVVMQRVPVLWDLFLFNSNSKVSAILSSHHSSTKSHYSSDINHVVKRVFYFLLTKILSSFVQHLATTVSTWQLP